MELPNCKFFSQCCNERSEWLIMCLNLDYLLEEHHYLLSEFQSVLSNRPCEDYSHLDNPNRQTTEIPGFNTLTIKIINQTFAMRNL